MAPEKKTVIYVSNEMMVSSYLNFATKIIDNSLVQVLDNIKQGDYESDINSIRYALHNGKTEQAASIKKGLMAFTASGTFGSSRTKKDLISYSNIVCLDLDDISAAELLTIKAKIESCEHTFSCFVSPSGEGLKVFVKVTSDENQHSIAYQQVVHYYESFLDRRFDPACKDITRLCFVSSDPTCFINLNATVFQVVDEMSTQHKQATHTSQHTSASSDAIEKCLKFTEQKLHYHPGNRNNFIFLLASNGNRMGIRKQDLEEFCVTNFDLNENEIKKSIFSAYKNTADFAKFATAVESTETSFGEQTDLGDDEDFLLKTPKIPQIVYDNLPPILKEGAKVFTMDRERDTFLTSALAVISGCMPNIEGTYGGKTVFANLFSFVLAPAASGKGALISAKDLAEKYHFETVHNSAEQSKQYKREMADYNREIKSTEKHNEISRPLPEEPAAKGVFIPANASSAGVYQQLQINEGRGIICETEADTMGQAFKNEWGAYSDLLRKAFHHEKASSLRKTNKDNFEINNPQLSIALSGTPKQVLNIISSAEDGLFSRFIYYLFKTESAWLDPSPYGNNINRTEYFRGLSDKVNDMAQFFSERKTYINLSEEQWQRFNSVFEKYLTQTSTFVSDDAQSIVKRMGLILYRICMIFTALRKFEARSQQEKVQCLDIDFESALALVEVFIKHSILMFSNLPKQNDNIVFKSNNNKQQYFNTLPEKFTRKEAVLLAKTFNIGERTVGNILKNSLGHLLQQPDYGLYEKMKK